jgi:hypothetical protein
MLLRALLDRLRGHRAPQSPSDQGPFPDRERARDSEAPSAFAFSFEGTLEELRARLQAVGPWRWQLRDSAWYGDYLLALDRPDGTRVRVYEDIPEEGRFTIEILWYAQYGPIEVWEQVVDLIRDQILPVVGVADVQPTESVD